MKSKTEHEIQLDRCADIFHRVIVEASERATVLLLESHRAIVERVVDGRISKTEALIQMRLEPESEDHWAYVNLLEDDIRMNKFAKELLREVSAI